MDLYYQRVNDCVLSLYAMNPAGIKVGIKVPVHIGGGYHAAWNRDTKSSEHLETNIPLMSLIESK